MHVARQHKYCSLSGTNTAKQIDINVEVSQCCFAKSPLLKCHCHSNCYINGQFSTFLWSALFFLSLSFSFHKNFLCLPTSKHTCGFSTKKGKGGHTDTNLLNLLLLLSFHISQSHTLLDNSTGILLTVCSFSG